MFALKCLLMTGAIGVFVGAVAVLGSDCYSECKFRCGASADVTGPVEPEPVRWKVTAALVALAWAPLLIAFCLFVIGSC
jgi:hypothetical protein